jgi:hypothetical protein
MSQTPTPTSKTKLTLVSHNPRFNAHEVTNYYLNIEDFEFGKAGIQRLIQARLRRMKMTLVTTEAKT